jgi:hypothetical protein
MTRPLAYLLTIVALVAGSGATCQRSMIVNPFGPPGPAAPQVLMNGAARDQIIAAVNQNSARIQSLSVTGASITIPDTLGLPLLSGNIAAERPGRFRLTASSVMGPELDLGSNDELFWLWVRRNQPPAVYICRHDRFATSNIRQVMPIEPSWLLAALGMVDLNPALVFDGPLPRSDGTVELRSWLPSSFGRLNRVTVIDARRAWVVEQHIYDESGHTLLASAVAESHRYYPVEQVSLPDRLSIRLPPSNINFKIDLGVMQINRLPPNAQQLWTLPTFAGYQQYDLGGAEPGTPVPGRLTAPVAPPGAQPAGNPAPYPSTGYSANGAAYTSNAQASDKGFMPLPRYGMREYLPAKATETANRSPTSDAPGNSGPVR